MKRRRDRTPGVWVLAGLGGIGKSTIALRLAAEAGRRGRAVWWINAGDPVSLNGGLLEILRQTGAPDALSGRQGPYVRGRRGPMLAGGTGPPPPELMT